MSYPEYQKAIKHPKKGAVAMNYDNFQADTARTLADRFCLQAQAVYEWAQRNDVDLFANGMYLSRPNCLLLEDVLNDTTESVVIKENTTRARINSQK